MSEYVRETFTHNGYTVQIIADQDPESPREWDNVGTMACWHDRYHLGDKPYRGRRGESPSDWLESLAKEYSPGFAKRWDNYHFRRMVGEPADGDYNSADQKARKARFYAARDAAMWKVIDANYVILPLGLIDHSGISMYVGSGAHSCDPGGWDSGQVGWIYADRKKCIEEWGGKSKRFTKHVREMAEQCLRQEVETYDQFLTGDVWGFVIEDANGEHVDSCWGFFGDEYCKQEAISCVPSEPSIKTTEDDAHEESLA